MSPTSPGPASAPAAAQNDAASDFFSKAGPVPTSWHEARRFARFYYRAQTRAKIYSLPGQPATVPVECTMLTRDLSRGGMNLLCTMQLFPGQRIDITLRDGTVRPVEVVWCRRMANRCYSLGCRFIKTGESTDLAGSSDAAASNVESGNPAKPNEDAPPAS